MGRSAGGLFDGLVRDHADRDGSRGLLRAVGEPQESAEAAAADDVAEGDRQQVVQQEVPVETGGGGSGKKPQKEEDEKLNSDELDQVATRIADNLMKNGKPGTQSNTQTGTQTNRAELDEAMQKYMNKNIAVRKSSGGLLY